MIFPLRGHAAMPGGIFAYHSWRGAANSNQWVEATDVAKHPLVPDARTVKHDPGPSAGVPSGETQMVSEGLFSLSFGDSDLLMPLTEIRCWVCCGSSMFDNCSCHLHVC